MKRFIHIGLYAALMTASACTTSGQPDYYTLMPVKGAPHEVRALTVKIDRPGLSTGLDRPQITSIGATGRIRYDNAALWAEPLDKLLEGALAQDLESRLPGCAIITESGGMDIPPDYIVDLEIKRLFDIDGERQLDGVLLLHTQYDDGKVEPVTISGKASRSTSGQAASLSEMTAKLADRIAEDIEKTEHHPH